MAVKPGKCYYFITHAYHHIVARVVEIAGTKQCDVELVRWIYSSDYGWEEFFKKGFNRDNAVYHVLPDGGITWIDYFEWQHPILEE